VATLQTRSLSVVEAEGPESGRTLSSAAGATVRVAVAADSARFEALFLSTLND
jgi:hypothetical protein